VRSGCCCGKGARDLADTVGAEVETDAGVFVVDGGQRLALVADATNGSQIRLCPLL